MMRSYRTEIVNFALVYAPPLFGGRGIITKGTEFSLRRAAEMLKEKRVQGIAVLGAYSNGKNITTSRMTKILASHGAEETQIVQIPFALGKTSPMEAVLEKFSFQNEFEEHLRSRKIVLIPVVPTNISEHFAIKSVALSGIWLRGYPEEVDVPLSLSGLIESVHYSIRDCFSRFARLIMS